MRWVIVLSGALILWQDALSFAQSNPIYVPFQPSRVKGALYKPDSGPAPRVAVLVIHRTTNFLSHPSTVELSRRGFMVLGLNPRSDNNETIVDFEENALDIKSGIEFLRKQPGIARVLLFGHSGAGPATTFYQAVAEKGPSYCQGSHKLVECTNELAGLPKADGIVLMDAHPSNAVTGLRDLNPAVLNEDPRMIDPALDPFSPANGFNPNGRSHYSDEFKRRYFEAQAARMKRLIDVAKARLQQIKEGRGAYPDDDIFVVPRGEGRRHGDDPADHRKDAKLHGWRLPGFPVSLGRRNAVADRKVNG